MSLPAVVQHIGVLQESGLVTSEKIGRVRTCRLEPGSHLQGVRMSVTHAAFTLERDYPYTPPQSGSAGSR
jgi:DNA-binding transcriptional ArsR family regulator